MLYKEENKLEEYHIKANPTNKKVGMATVYKWVRSLNLEKMMDMNAPMVVYPNHGIMVNTEPLVLVR